MFCVYIYRESEEEEEDELLTVEMGWDGTGRK
jgi:hypothetical protein